MDWSQKLESGEKDGIGVPLWRTPPREFLSALSASQGERKRAIGRRPISTPNPNCLCGCGLEVYLPWNKFCQGHQWNDRLHPRQVGRIKKLLALGVWTQEAAKIYRVSLGTINKIQRGQWARFNKWKGYVRPVRIEQILEARKPIEEMKEWVKGKKQLQEVKLWLRSNAPQCR